MSRFMDPRHAGLTPYVPGEQPRDRKYIKLNTNENPYPPSPRVTEVTSRAAVESQRLYNDPEAVALRRAIAEFYGVDIEQVLVGDGSDEVLAFAFQAFCGKKGVAYPEYSYGFYAVFAGLYGVKGRAVPLRPDFTIDVNDYLVPGENVVLANPNAPTGLVLSHAEIETILRAHPDDVVLVDEAYVDFGSESLVSLVDKYDNLLVVQTFSKSRSLAGARIGFAISGREIMSDMQTIRNSCNPYNVSTLSQLAGIEAMRDVDYFRETVDKVIATRERVEDRLLELGCELNRTKTNFIFVKLPGVSGPEGQEKLRQRGILIRRFNQPGIEDYLRVSIGTDEEMDAFLAATERIIREARA